LKLENIDKRIILSPILILCGIYLFYGGLLSQWLGVVSIIYGILISKKLLSGFIPLKIKERLSPFVAPGIITTMMVGIYHKLLMGHMPWLADHSVHETKAWILKTKLLSSFRFSGWTHFAGGGYPAETLYPPFVDYYISFIKFITFGLLSWEQSYALAFFLFLLFYVLVFYYAGKKIAGKTGGKTAGFIAALFAMVDVGAFRQGGWIFTVRWGVWPLTLSIALTILAVFALDDYLKKRRSFQASSIWGSIAILTHPISLLLLIPTGILLVWYRFAKGEKPGILIIKTIFSIGLMILISACWLIPFFSYGSEYSSHVSSLAGSINNVAAGLFNPNPWGASWGWAAALGILGAVELIRRGKSPIMSAMIITSAGALVLGSTSFIAGLGLFEIFPSFKHLQFPRFLLFVKATAYLSAGWFLSQLIYKTSSTKYKREWASKAVTIFLLAALIIPLAQHFYENRISSLSNFPTNPKIKNGMEEVNLKLKNDPQKPKGFFRVAYDGSFSEHRHTRFAILSGIPFVKLTFVPSDTYKFRSRIHPSTLPKSTKELKLLNVAYVVSIGPSKLKKIKLMFRKNGVYLYKFLDYSPQRAWSQNGNVTVKSFDDELIKLQISNLPKEGGLVQIPVSPFPKWKVYNNGKEIEQLRWKPSKNLTFMGAHVKNGTITFRYEKGLWDYIGILLTLIGLLLIAIPISRFNKITNKTNLLFNSVFLSTKAKWSQLLKTVSINIYFKWVLFLISLTVLLLSIIIIKNHEYGDSQFKLSHAKLMIKHSNGTKTGCFWFFPQRWRCGEKLNYAGIEARLFTGEVKTGIFLHPLLNNTHIFSFSKVTMGKRLKIGFGIDDYSHRNKGIPIQFILKIDGVVNKKWMVKQIGLWIVEFVETTTMRGEPHNITIEISSSKRGVSNFLFTPSIIDP
jgi:hypothetical protein